MSHADDDRPRIARPVRRRGADDRESARDDAARRLPVWAWAVIGVGVLAVGLGVGALV